MGEGGIMAAIAAIAVYLVLSIAILIVMVVSYWKIYVKAGKPGWAAIVPIYNIIVLLEVIKKPTWWLVLCIIPCTLPVALVLIALEFVKVFGKPSWHAALMIFFGVIYAPYIAFSDAKYVG
ncbi:MAG TPA: DUF5684 domain-containing protein [Spirochaetota bacterium]|nr:DUF5684 domain-containing protein [Spirochaetota bacterium]